MNGRESATRYRTGARRCEEVLEGILRGGN